MIRLDEFYNIMKEYKLKFESRHLLLPEENFSHKERQSVVKKIFSCLGDTRCDDENLYLIKKRCCLVKNCVAPCCYEFRIKGNLKESLLTKEDIEEMSEDIDLHRIEQIGFEKYLEEYNKDQVDILKISLQELKLIYNYAKGKE